MGLRCSEIYFKGTDHQCCNLEILQIEEIPIDCNCTFLEAFYRYSKEFTENFQENFENTIYKLFPDRKFKEELVKTFVKMNNFLIIFKEDKKRNNKITEEGSVIKYKFGQSKFKNIYMQFFAPDLQELWVNSPNFFNNFTKIKRLINVLNNSEQFKEAYDILLSIYSIFVFLKGKPYALKGKILASYKEEENLARFILESFMENLKTCFISIEQIKCIFHINVLYLDIFQTFLTYFDENNVKKSKEFLFNLLEIGLRKFSKQCNFDFEEGIKKNEYFFIYLNNHRFICAIFVQIFSLDNNWENLILEIKDFLGFSFLKVLQKYFYFVLKMQVIFEKIEKEFKIKHKEDISNPNLIYDYLTNPKKILIEDFYKGSFFYLWDYDICSLQFSLLFLDLNQIFESIREFMNENKFLCLLFEILCLICVNESCLFNIFKGEEIKLNWMRNSIEFLISTAFITENCYDFNTVKSKLNKGIVNNKEIKLEKFICNVAKLDEKKKMFNKFSDKNCEFEPYIWFKSPKLFSEFYDFVKNKIEKNSPSSSSTSFFYDFVIGNRKKMGFYSFLEKILSKCDFIFSEILFIFERKSLNVELVKHSIKLCSIFFKIPLEEPESFSNIVYAFRENNLINAWDFYKSQKEFNDYINSFIYLEKMISELNKRKMFLKNHLINKEEKNTDIQESETIKKETACLLEEQKKKKILIDEKILKKKAKIQGEFLQMQKKFLVNNIDIIPIEDKKNEKIDSMICLCCHISDGELNIKNVLGVAAYICPDSLSNFYYGNIKKKSLLLEGEENNSLLQNNNFDFIITSCSHILHSQCQFLNSKLYGIQSQTEKLCPFCKSISNVLVPIIEPFLVINNIGNNSFIYKEEKNIYNIEEMIFNIKDLIIKENYEIDYCHKFFNKEKFHIEDIDQVMKGLFNSFLFVVEQAKMDENMVLRVINDVLIYLAESIFTNGLNEFFQRNFYIMRNLFLVFRIKFWTFNNCSLKEFILNYKMKFLNDFLEFINLDIIGKSQSFILGIENLYCNLLLKICVIFLDNENILWEYLNFINRIFFNKLIYFYSFSFNEEEKEEENYFENLSEKWEKDEVFRLKLFGFLKPYLELSAGIFITFFNLINMKEEILSCKNNYEEMDLFFMKFGNHFKIHSQFQNFFRNKSKLSNKKALNLQGQKLLEDIKKNPCLKFEIIYLGENFKEMSDLYFYQKCEKCQNFPKNESSNLFLCLICGIVICSKNCLQKKNNGEILGNLNKHVNEFHSQKTVFLNIIDGQILFIDNANILIYKNLFYNNFGQKFNFNKADDWENYFIDKNIIQDINEFIRKRKIPHEIHYKFDENPDFVMQNCFEF